MGGEAMFSWPSADRTLAGDVPTTLTHQPTHTRSERTIGRWRWRWRSDEDEDEDEDGAVGLA
jgi:hypothetical protein